MTAAPPGGPADPGGRETSARTTYIAMALVLLVSLLIFVWGFVSLILDRDIIEESGAGPLVGPAMVVAIAAVVLSALLRASAVERPARSAVAAGLATVIAAPVAGALVYAVGTGELAASVVFVGRHIIDPFVLSGALVAALIVFGFGLVLRGR